MQKHIVKKTVDEWLDTVDYKSLNHGNYVPSKFALGFVNFIKLVNGGQGEANKTPVFHYKMLDQLIGQRNNIANLCFRGSAKTSIFGEYLIPYLALMESIPEFGKVEAMIYVSDSMDNGAKSLRKNIEFRYDSSEFLQEFMHEANFTDARLDFVSKKGHKLGCKLYGAKTGIRGTKIYSKRPTLAILDDLVSDEDSRSPALMDKIRTTIHKGIGPALDPTKKKIIFNGTPFTSDDVLYKAVESGAWHVNVFPICEKFPCDKKDFNGAWEDRFTYDFIKTEYNNAKLEGELSAFYQEYMLRISSEDNKLVPKEIIEYFDLNLLLDNIHQYNIYITTDFATTDKQSSDYSVIAVWAVNNKGQFFLIDGICKRQKMSENIDDLFKLAQKYYGQLQTVGIETSGQQGAFIQWINEQQMQRNVFFVLAREKGKTSIGVRPIANKLARFNLTVPLFHKGFFKFPMNHPDANFIKEFLDEIDKATVAGLKGKDDCLDTISMLMYIDIVLPSFTTQLNQSNVGNTNMWGIEENNNSNNRINSYLVN